MDETIVITNFPPDCEYFCRDCQQLRLSFLDKTEKCGACGSSDIVKGEPGELDKGALLLEGIEVRSAKEAQDG